MRRKAQLLRISSDRNDQKNFWGFEIFNSGIFSGREIRKVFFYVA